MAAVIGAAADREDVGGIMAMARIGLVSSWLLVPIKLWAWLRNLVLVGAVLLRSV